MSSKTGTSDFRPSSALQVGSFASRLRKAKGERKGVSLSSATGISTSVISNYLKGKTLPGMEHLVLMAKELEVTVDWLAAGEGPMRYPLNNHSMASESGDECTSDQINVDLLESVIRGIEIGLQNAQVQIDVGVRARLIADSYKERIKTKHLG